MYTAILTTVCIETKLTLCITIICGLHYRLHNIMQRIGSKMMLMCTMHASMRLSSCLHCCTQRAKIVTRKAFRTIWCICTNTFGTRISLTHTRHHMFLWMLHVRRLVSRMAWLHMLSMFVGWNMGKSMCRMAWTSIVSLLSSSCRLGWWRIHARFL